MSPLYPSGNSFLSWMVMTDPALRDSVVNGGIKYLSNKVVLICLFSSVLSPFISP